MAVSAALITTNIAVMSSAFSSFKWISGSSSNRESNQLTVNSLNTSVFHEVERSNCNLISIFGRARQGKSFLMNCLAGEKEIFRISNEKDSCTQGIDISNKWLSLTDFSKIDGGRVSIIGKIKIGFVDAEGQGDKDISYGKIKATIITLLVHFILIMEA